MGSGSAAAAAVAELLEQVVRIAHSRAFAAGLNPAQWTALRYFARANESSRSVTAFARYHASGRGTASQTVSALVRKGYLARQALGGRGSPQRIGLTAEGQGLLIQDPVRHLIAGIEALPEGANFALAEALEVLLSHMFAGEPVTEPARPEATAPATAADPRRRAVRPG